MFRSAAQVEITAAEKKLQQFKDHWVRTADEWFDGSVESVEKRIARLDQVIAFAGRAAHLQGSRVGSFCLSALPNLKANREELSALRRQLAGFGDDHWAPWREHFEQGDARAEWGGPEGHGRGFVAPGGDNGFADLPPEGMAIHRDPTGRERILDPGGEERFSSRTAASYDQPKHDWDKYGPQPGEPPKPRHRHEDLGFSGEDVERLKARSAAAEFLSEQNTSDRTELLVRAARLVEARTSTWSVDASARAVRDFVGAVGDQIPRARRTARQHTAVAHVDDFEDHLMFS